MKKWIAIATLLLGGVVAAQSAPCPVSITEAKKDHVQLKNYGRPTRLHYKELNSTSKQITAIKFELDWYDATHDAVGLPLVLSGTENVKPNDTKGTSFALDPIRVPDAAKSVNFYPTKVVFADGSDWTNPGTECGVLVK